MTSPLFQSSDKWFVQKIWRPLKETAPSLYPCLQCCSPGDDVPSLLGAGWPAWCRLHHFSLGQCPLTSSSSSGTVSGLQAPQRVEAGAGMGMGRSEYHSHCSLHCCCWPHWCCWHCRCCHYCYCYYCCCCCWHCWQGWLPQRLQTAQSWWR